MRTLTDITRLDLFQSSLGLYPEAVLYLDNNGNVIAANAVCQAMFGLDQRETHMKHLSSFVREENWEYVQASFERALHGSSHVIETIAQTPGLGDIEVRITFVPVFSENNVAGVYAIFKDIRRDKQLELEMKRLMYRDELTLLPNKRCFHEILERKLLEGKQCGLKMAVIMVDLDQFRDINDSLGFQVGDHLLIEIAQRLVSLLGNCAVARFEKDEFAILLQQFDRIRDVRVKVEEIFSLFVKAIPFREQEIVVSPSIGISLFPKDGEQSDALVHKAKVALKWSKKQGGNSFCFYSREFERKMMDRFNLTGDLRRAIEREELVLHYQPMVDVRTGEITALEALVRWNHPAKGEIPPIYFIPIAEENGLIESLSNWVLRTACMQAKQIKCKTSPFLRVAVNLSAKQFQNKNLPNTVRQILLDTGLDATNLELEITESTVMKNTKHTIKILQELREMGIQISIDDFGTGYSSLSYLKRFPISNLKIDKSFIRNIEERTETVAIVKAIITMAQQLNLSVTAEGVETIDELSFLREQNCNTYQGFLIAKPMSFENITQFIEERRGPLQLKERGD